MDLTSLEKFYQFFYAHDCLKIGLSNAVAQPVALPGERFGFPEMYWDCAIDTEQEKAAEDLMRKRIAYSGGYMKTHFAIFRGIGDKFKEISKCFLENREDEVGQFARGIKDSFLKYLDLVKAHRRQSGENAFLIFPHSMPGHVKLYDRSVITLDFNPENNLDGAERGIREFSDLADKFSRIASHHERTYDFDTTYACTNDDAFFGNMHVSRQVYQKALDEFKDI